MEKLLSVLKTNVEELGMWFYSLMQERDRQIETFINETLPGLLANAGKYKNDISEHLVNFFSKFYDEGIFIPPRNVKFESSGDVSLCWPTKDLYYVKTGEYFTKYIFDTGGLTVQFKLLNAQIEKNNNKPTKPRFLLLHNRKFSIQDNQLTVYFEYRSLTDEEESTFNTNKVNQKIINTTIISELHQILPNDVKSKLFKKVNGKTLIEKQLSKYTKIRKIDYFIHKNIKDFLTKELDEYIQIELLKMQKIQQFSLEQLHEYFQAINVFRACANSIIEILSRFEDLNKNEWERKKFILETHYVITLDKIIEYAGKEFLASIIDEILDNEEQMREWKELFNFTVTNKDDFLESLSIKEEYEKLKKNQTKTQQDNNIKRFEFVFNGNKVDIIETFNYLLGIKVKVYKTLNENGRKYVFVLGEKENRKIAIIWRSMEEIDLEKDKEIIKETLKEFNPDEIYINGDAIVENFKAIEPLFKSLMFEEMR